MSLDKKKCLCWIHNHIPSDVTSKSRNSDSLSRYLRWILCEIVLYIVLLLLFLLLIWKQVMIVIGTYIKSNKLWKRKLILDIGRCMLSIGNFSFLFSAQTLLFSQLCKVNCTWLALNVLSVLPNIEGGVTPKRFKIFQSFNGSYIYVVASFSTW